jgi:hypothetical protein
MRSLPPQRITDLSGAFSQPTVPLSPPAPQALTAALGDPPMSFSEFVRQNLARFTDREPGREISGVARKILD